MVKINRVFIKTTVVTGLILALIMILPVYAGAASVTLTLSAYSVLPGETVTASGTADPDRMVSIKVLGGDQHQDVVYYAGTKSDGEGNYRHDFKVPPFTGSLWVVSGYGENVESKQLHYRTDGPAPSDTTPPTWSQGSLSFSNLTQTGLRLEWSGAADDVGVSGYRVYRGTTLLTASLVGAAGYIVTGLNPGTEYTFTVQAVDAAGNESTDGPSVIVTTTRASESSTGGGGGSTPQAVVSTTVAPGAGGTVSLGNAAKIVIPANALQGAASVEVKIEKVTDPLAPPAGLRVLGDVYRFSVGGADSYNFNGPVTLTFSFDPAALAPGEKAEIHYYDPSAGTWVSLGGTVAGNTITVTVDHFSIFAVLAGTPEALEIETEPILAGPPEGYSLSDIAGHWAVDYINELVSLGAIAGYPDGSFRPDSSITRAEFATVLVKAFKLELTGGKVFDDTAGHWARDSIAAASAVGIVSGYDDTNFGPDDLITREQMAVMIAKAAMLPPAGADAEFADSGSISAWAREAMAAVVENGIMKGYPDNTVRPNANATRAEAVTVIVQALK